MTFVSVVTSLNPSAWYRCNDAIGVTTLNDSSGNQHVGSIVNGPIPTVNQCGGWTGDGNHSIQVLPGGFLQPPNGVPGTTLAAFTISFIVRPMVIGSAQFICGFSNAINNQGWDVCVTGNIAGFFLQVQGVNSSSNANFSDVGTSSRGKPFMVTITYDGTSNWIVYTNGVQRCTVNNALTFIPSGATLKIGQAYNSQGPASTFSAQFQDIILFSSALSSANVLALYNAAAPTGFISSPPLGITSNQATNVLSWSAPTGGSGTYNYSLTRSLTSNYVPSSTDTVIYTGNALTFTDTPPDGQVYYYHVSAIDSLNSSISSNESVGSAFGIAQSHIAIGALGDSRTFGADGTTTVLQQLQQYLELNIGTTTQVSTSNQGISGSTSYNWVSGQTNLNNAITAFTALANALPSSGKFYIIFNLGINDAQTINLTSVANYIANLTNTINALKAANFKCFAGIILNYTFPVVIGTAPVTYDEITMNLVALYNASMSTLVDNVAVFLGDTQAVQYFSNANNLVQFGDGLHLNNGGYTAWGFMIGKVMVNILKGIYTQISQEQAVSAGTIRGYATNIFNFNGTRYIKGMPIYDPDYTALNSLQQYKADYVRLT